MTTLESIIDFLLLRDPNTRVVVLGTSLLGLAAGIIGVFALLRKRVLIGDALSHAALPGICCAFLLIGSKHFLWLLLGAFVSGSLGMLLILLLSRYTRIAEETAIGVVLSSFFALGICLSRSIQNHPNGMQAGLESFLFGRAASMLAADAMAITTVCLVVIILCFLFFKEFTLLCFDSAFGRVNGWPVLLLDLLLMSCIIIVTIIGLQSVGVVLIIALLITPAAAARFWSERLSTIVFLSGLFGALSGIIGSALSAVVEKLPTGPSIVLVAAFLFLCSLLFAPQRGLFARALESFRIRREMGQQHFYRALFEIVQKFDSTGIKSHSVNPILLPHSVIEPMLKEPWWKREFERSIKTGLLEKKNDLLQITPDGVKEMRQAMRRTRLWELYLIHCAEVAPSHVDASIDSLEHILSPELLKSLEDAVEKDLGLQVEIPA